MMDFKNNSLQHSIWGGTNIRWTHWVTPCTPLHHFCTNLIPLGLTILSSFCCKDLFFSLLLSVVRVEGYQGPLVIHRGQFSFICETDIKIGITVSMLRQSPEILIVVILCTACGKILLIGAWMFCANFCIKHGIFHPCRKD